MGNLEGRILIYFFKSFTCKAVVTINLFEGDTNVVQMDPADIIFKYRRDPV